MVKLAGWLLRAVLVVALLGSVLVQVLVPVEASQVGAANPEVAYLVGPYSLAAILFIGCGQVALLVVMRLLSLVDGGAIFTRAAVRWVDLIVACGIGATVLAAGVLIHMLGFVPGGGGPAIYAVAGAITGASASALLVVVIRGLLESVIADRAASVAAPISAP
jgi:hypothetical protein